MAPSIRDWTLARRTAGLLLAAYWAAIPVANAIYFTSERRRGALPDDPEFFGLLVGGVNVAWVCVTPVVGWLLWRALRDAPARFAWLAFDGRRPLASGAWSALFVAMAGTELATAVISLGDGHPEEVITGLLGCVALLALRAAVCAPSPGGEAGDQPDGLRVEPAAPELLR